MLLVEWLSSCAFACRDPTSTAPKAAQDEERGAKATRMEEITVVLLELNGNPGPTFQLKRDLEQDYRNSR